jgi:hypothetical protein
LAANGLQKKEIISTTRIFSANQAGDIEGYIGGKQCCSYVLLAVRKN